MRMAHRAYWQYPGIELFEFYSFLQVSYQREIKGSICSLCSRNIDKCVSYILRQLYFIRCKHWVHRLKRVDIVPAFVYDKLSHHKKALSKSTANLRLCKYHFEASRDCHQFICCTVCCILSYKNLSLIKTLVFSSSQCSLSIDLHLVYLTYR